MGHFLPRTEDQESEILYIFQKNQLSEEDCKYLHSKYRTMNNEVMQRGDLLPWEKMGGPKTAWFDESSNDMLKSPQKLTLFFYTFQSNESSLFSFLRQRNAVYSKYQYDLWRKFAGVC